jgi:hypothetical protein
MGMILERALATLIVTALVIVTDSFSVLRHAPGTRARTRAVGTSRGMRVRVAMAGEGAQSSAKRVRARQMLEDSRAAFAAARDAIRATNSTEDQGCSRILREEFRMRAQWSRTGRALFGTWFEVFGRETGVSGMLLRDPLGLQCARDSEKEEECISAAFNKIDSDCSGTIDKVKL